MNKSHFDDIGASTLYSMAYTIYKYIYITIIGLLYLKQPANFIALHVKLHSMLVRIKMNFRIHLITLLSCRQRYQLWYHLDFRAHLKIGASRIKKGLMAHA